MKFKFRNMVFAALAFIFVASTVPSKAVLGDQDDPVSFLFVPGNERSELLSASSIMASVSDTGCISHEGTHARLQYGNDLTIKASKKDSQFLFVLLDANDTDRYRDIPSLQRKYSIHVTDLIPVVFNTSNDAEFGKIKAELRGFGLTYVFKGENLTRGVYFLLYTVGCDQKSGVRFDSGHCVS